MSFWEAPASAAGVGGMTSSGSTPPETPPETTGSCLVLGAEADGVGPSVLFTCGASGSGRQYLFGAAEGFSRLALECRQRPSSRLRVVFLVSFVPRAAGGLGGLLLRLCADGHQEVTIAGPPGVGTYVAGVRDFNRFRHPTVTTLRLVPQNVASSDFCQDDTAACDAAAESYRDDSVLVFPLFSESLDTTKNETGNNETCQVCDAVNEETAAMESDSEFDSQDTDSAAAADDANVSTHGTPPAKRTKQAPRMKHTCTNPEAQTLNQDTQNPRVNPKTARAALGYAVGVRDVRNPKKISSLFLVFDCRDDKDATALAKHPTVRCCLADGGCVSPVTPNGGGYAGKHPTQHPRAAAVFHLTPRNVAARPAYDSARRVSPLRKNENEPCFEKQPTHVDCVVRGEVGFRAGARTLARLHAVDTNAFPISPALMAPYRVAVAAGTGVGKQGQEKEKASSYGAGAGVGSADGSLCAVVTLFSSGSEKNEFLPGVVDQHSFRQDELDVDAVITQVTTQLAAMERGDEPSRLEEESGEKNARIESGRNSSSTCPSILFLGTGSAEPSKYRGSSGILVKLPGAVKGYALLDCGEGTAGALIRFLGGNESKRVVDELKVRISH
jgi:ribonuclease Z